MRSVHHFDSFGLFAHGGGSGKEAFEFLDG